MVVQNKLMISPDQPVLLQILKPLGLNYVQFARRLNIGISTLENYRRGTRKLRMSTDQVKTLVSLLEEVGLDIRELPDDWILDKKL